ncbi:glycerol-3-phosphate dehydrogenase, NAD(P)-dependent [Citrifermentans bemidjiense Bem]|uniref:Glycerol-3-phosphate dehydrogenase [NAD(P)+] n=1 Tax=Citrifermentans bemidjiense (strain ATCC BAA-1014 / DSM 16622 / JCM 12645 / Bem) TaxID=404380 RepID=GPDA_CITBB|nr:NAD(P)H-dependent glycerol-3-phosphate dehydrogenase [Citrifermentans bemidjiense]B5E7Q3.1 RecName: Full=Glycerol-3-phosphate dehydrogenase [NAD(P)+]; AltName: Full=NAD(P)H-dependent glycerol-3-phosphate dehydrogenase [Citrifermentans bemidjiense Bem]ACH37039.1 glycerol-3-phosphate dehydrogenase, NAD(P)-dependent [Citrifermentans bemidjiense Bem]
MAEKIAVIGAGSWGTTLADLLAKKGHEVTLWAYEPELVLEMRDNRENSLFLPGIKLNERLAFTNDLAEAYRGCSMVLCVVPSQLVRRVMTNSLPFLPKEAIIVSASKGIEVDTLATVSEIYQEILPPEQFQVLAALSGPSFAREVALEMPTAVTAAASSEAVARRVQEAFTTDYFRVYRNSDVVGVELGGAIKNVIAIAAGISDGLGFGSNTRAALITRGLAEMTRLGVAMGAQPSTFAGLAGMGDLVLTCTGDLSRNRSVGIQIGQGRTLSEILGEMRMVAEGVKTTESAYNLAKKLGVEMPIIEQMYQMLYQNKSAREAVLELMTRNLKAEGV